MAYLVISLDGQPILTLLDDGKGVASLAQHIASGYPDLVEHLQAGRLSASVSEIAPAVTIPDDVLLYRSLRSPGRMLAYFSHFENRVRALEGKPPLTAAQFRTAIRTVLGAE